MEELVSILHISDLHRSKDCEITNKSLLSSLVNDKDSYTQSESPKIKAPDIIIVSGDIIRGFTNIDSSEHEVKEQYTEALNFLNDLVTHFLNGDKQRLLVIPGNHDIDWKYSKESMNKIENNLIFDSSNNVKTQLLKEVINQHSKIRWSWKDLSFYKINDQWKYDNRLKAFANFYSELYKGERKYSIDPKSQYDIFDFANFNITIAAYNSCYGNDHLRLTGDINPDCMGDANLKLREYKKKGRLILATWHHNTKGLPYDSNYMDSSKLKNFINSGIVLGFHGHQHKTELIHEYSDAIEQKKIIVFSAGTLCGGPNELPTGNNRQYNLVEIKSNDDVDFIDVKLHIREKTDSSSFDNPIWAAGRIDSNLVSYHIVKIDKPKAQEVGTILIEIEQLMKNKKFEDAKKRLLKLPSTDDFVRKFLLECIIQTQDYDLALKIYSQPKIDAECITILDSAIRLNDKAKMRDCLSGVKNYGSTNSIITELTKKIEALLK